MIFYFLKIIFNILKVFLICVWVLLNKFLMMVFIFRCLIILDFDIELNNHEFIMIT